MSYFRGYNIVKNFVKNTNFMDIYVINYQIDIHAIPLDMSSYK